MNNFMDNNNIRSGALNHTPFGLQQCSNASQPELDKKNNPVCKAHSSHEFGVTKHSNVFHKEFLNEQSHSNLELFCHISKRQISEYKISNSPIAFEKQLSDAIPKLLEDPSCDRAFLKDMDEKIKNEGGFSSADLSKIMSYVIERINAHMITREIVIVTKRDMVYITNDFGAIDAMRILHQMGVCLTTVQTQSIQSILNKVYVALRITPLPVITLLDTLLCMGISVDESKYKRLAMM